MAVYGHGVTSDLATPPHPHPPLKAVSTGDKVTPKCLPSQSKLSCWLGHTCGHFEAKHYTSCSQGVSPCWFPIFSEYADSNAVTWYELWFLGRLEQSIGRSSAVTTGLCNVFAAWTWIYSQNLFGKNVCRLQKWFLQTPNFTPLMYFYI